MSIDTPRKRKLRLTALSIVWQVIDMATREIDLNALDDPYSDEEVAYMLKVIDQKAQAAFNAHAKYKAKIFE
jgi:hypothetical protein